MNDQLKQQLDRILEFPHVFQVILREDPEQNVYEEFDVDQRKGTLGKYASSLVTVISVQKINEIYYVLFKSSGEIIGWTAVSESIYVHPKTLESVKVDVDALTPHPINEALIEAGSMAIDLRGRLLASKAFIDVDDRRLEALFIKDRLMGFVESGQLHKGRAMSMAYTVPAGTPRYRDSNLSVELPGEDTHHEVEINLHFPELGILRLTYMNRQYWLEDSAIEADLSDVAEALPPVVENVHKYYEDEREKSKAIIDGLLRRQVQLEKNLDQSKERLKRVETLYSNLKKSKLGRLQTKIWERRKRRVK
ncbi:SH3-like domain-containing protein [Salinicoccus roseus]|uniref:Uncharacterized protein n=1 Tax=Salinicoccus roseus TaxID=45670 RepID=A0A265E5N5_9STAP|nr:SH3-like domain-containing protein [Salinicoccus roseus]OZT76904.1 hypothetical protein CFN03_07440 [Salinicoccus roseus]